MSDKKEPTKKHCAKCNKLAHLSGNDLCPACVREWIKEYQSYHKSKRSHYAR